MYSYKSLAPYAPDFIARMYGIFTPYSSTKAKLFQFSSTILPAKLSQVLGLHKRHYNLLKEMNNRDFKYLSLSWITWLYWVECGRELDAQTIVIQCFTWGRMLSIHEDDRSCRDQFSFGKSWDHNISFLAHMVPIWALFLKKSHLTFSCCTGSFSVDFFPSRRLRDFNPLM